MPPRADPGPVCPGCGYAIFGIRDMRCPECGRTLDVRDFSLASAESRGDSARYERTTAAAGAVGAVLLLGLLVALLMLLALFVRFGRIPIIIPIAIVAVAITLAGVLSQTWRSLLALGKHKRR